MKKYNYILSLSDSLDIPVKECENIINTFCLTIDDYLRDLIVSIENKNYSYSSNLANDLIGMCSYLSLDKIVITLNFLVLKISQKDFCLCKEICKDLFAFTDDFKCLFRG